MARNLKAAKAKSSMPPRSVKETSVRFTPAERQGLLEGARLAGESKSQFVREAVKERLDRLKTALPAHEWSEYLGALSGPKTDVAQEQKTTFADRVSAKHKR